MTREEAVEILEEEHDWSQELSYVIKAIEIALTALRPVSREQVEKVWKGRCACSKPKACCTCCSMHCHDCIGQSEYRQAAFCMKCGRPMTDTAVDMVMERLEALKDGRVH